MSSDPVARYVRDEPDAHRLDRNYAELLQELRVVLTGVQILFAFLLAIVFQQRFAALSDAARGLFLVALFSSASASVLLTAPAAVHRILFRYNVKDEIVDVTARLVKVGMACLAVAMVTAVCFVVMFVAGIGVALAMATALALLVVGTWLVGPRRRRVHCKNGSLFGLTYLQQASHHIVKDTKDNPAGIRVVPREPRR